MHAILYTVTVVMLRFCFLLGSFPVGGLFKDCSLFVVFANIFSLKFIWWLETYLDPNTDLHQITPRGYRDNIRVGGFFQTPFKSTLCQHCLILQK